MIKQYRLECLLATENVPLGYEQALDAVLSRRSQLTIIYTVDGVFYSV